MKRLIAFAIFGIIFVYSIFSLIKCLTWLFIKGGSLSSNVIVSWGKEFESISLNVLLNKKTLSFISKPYLTFVKWWIVDSEIEFSKYYLMMAILVKRRVDTRTHHQIWLRGKGRLTQDTEFPWMWVISLIICSSPNWEIMAWIVEPSEVVVSPVYHLLDFALKSPMATIKKGLVAETVSSVSSKLLHKFSDWFGDLCKEIKLQILSQRFISKVIHSLM